jgi:hypothetical protein
MVELRVVRRWLGDLQLGRVRLKRLRVRSHEPVGLTARG